VQSTWLGLAGLKSGTHADINRHQPISTDINRPDTSIGCCLDTTRLTPIAKAALKQPEAAGPLHHGTAMWGDGHNGLW
jgi:hypothetical protein